MPVPLRRTAAITPPTHQNSPPRAPVARHRWPSVRRLASLSHRRQTTSVDRSYRTTATRCRSRSSTFRAFRGRGTSPRAASRRIANPAQGTAPRGLRRRPHCRNARLPAYANASPSVAPEVAVSRSQAVSSNRWPSDVRQTPDDTRHRHGTSPAIARRPVRNRSSSSARQPAVSPTKLRYRRRSRTVRRGHPSRSRSCSADVLRGSRGSSSRQNRTRKHRRGAGVLVSATTVASCR